MMLNQHMANSLKIKETRLNEARSRATYAKPELTKHSNLKEITFECPNWQCSVVVPAPPAP